MPLYHSFTVVCMAHVSFSDTEKQNKTELVFIGYGKVISVYVYVCWEIMLIYIYREVVHLYVLYP